MSEHSGKVDFTKCRGCGRLEAITELLTKRHEMLDPEVTAQGSADLFWDLRDRFLCGELLKPTGPDAPDINEHSTAESYAFSMRKYVLGLCLSSLEKADSHQYRLEQIVGECPGYRGDENWRFPELPLGFGCLRPAAMQELFFECSADGPDIDKLY
jgi:hypothetical protein